MHFESITMPIECRDLERHTGSDEANTLMADRAIADFDRKLAFDFVITSKEMTHGFFVKRDFETCSKIVKYISNELVQLRGTRHSIVPMRATGKERESICATPVGVNEFVFDAFRTHINQLS